MNTVLMELVKRKQTRDKIDEAISHLFTIDLTMNITERAPTKNANYLKRETVYEQIRQRCNIPWSPKNSILLREALEAAGAKTTNSHGYIWLVNVNIKASVLPDTPNDAGETMEQ